jgi:hypothetical protein
MKESATASVLAPRLDPRAKAGQTRPSAPTLIEALDESRDQFALFRALPLALGLSAICWTLLAALGFGIYTLVKLH